MKQQGFTSCLRIVLGMLALLLTLSANVAQSHSFYSQWKTATGMSCCNQNDCRPIDSIDMRFAEWRAR